MRGGADSVLSLTQSSAKKFQHQKEGRANAEPGPPDLSSCVTWWKRSSTPLRMRGVATNPLVVIPEGNLRWLVPLLFRSVRTASA